MPDQWTTSDLFEEPEVEVVRAPDGTGVLVHHLTEAELVELLARERNLGYDEGWAARD